VLFVAVVGLAVSASGCIIDGSSSSPSCGGTPAGCVPDLTINWQVSRASTGGPITCDAAGGADTVVALIDGGCFGSTVYEFDGLCAAGTTAGSFLAQLPGPGSDYGVSLELHSGGPTGLKLSETPIAVFSVNCSGNSATQVADLSVNF